MNETQKLAKRSPLWGMMALLSMLVPSLPSSAQLMVPGAPQSQTHQNMSDTSGLPQLNPADQQRFDQLMAEVKRDRPTPQTWRESIEFFALKLLGQPYKAGLLDQSPTEDLILSLTEFDCVLFVESVLALAHSATLPTSDLQPSSTQFARQIQTLRYRDGIQDGYCSRLHYFSEWLDNNQTHGYVQNLSQTLGGIPLNKRLQFMSRHRQSYPQLTSNKAYDCIVAMEDRLASLPMHYIPTANINQVESQLQAGDIIAVATAVPYLDVTHTGLMYQAQNGRMGLIHASPGGSVRLAPNLAEYVSQVESAIGVMVARPLEPQ